VRVGALLLQDRVLHTTTDLSVIEKNQMTFETFQKALPRIATEFYPTQPERQSTRGPSRMTRSKTSTETARADSLMKLVTAQFDRSASLRSPRKEKVVIKRAWGAPPPPKKVCTTLLAFLLLIWLYVASLRSSLLAQVELMKRERKTQKERDASGGDDVPVYLTQPMAPAPMAAVQLLLQQHIPRLRRCTANPMRSVLVEAMSHNAMAFFEGAAFEVMLQVIRAAGPNASLRIVPTRSAPTVLQERDLGLTQPLLPLQVYFALALGSDVAELVEWSAAELLHDLQMRETRGGPTSVSLFRLAQWAQDAALVSRCDCRLTRGSLAAHARSFDVSTGTRNAIGVGYIQQDPIRLRWGHRGLVGAN